MSAPVTVVGTIATDPKLVVSRGKTSFCTFRVACNERRYDRERSRWVDTGTNWFSVSAFRSLAEHANESFAKDDRVVVSGRLRIRDWERAERSGTSVEVEADALGHDLRWGVSRFEKRVGADSSDTRARKSGATTPSGGANLGGGRSADPHRDAQTLELPGPNAPRESSETWLATETAFENDIPIPAAA